MVFVKPHSNVHTYIHNCQFPLYTRAPVMQHNCTPHHPSLSLSDSMTVNRKTVRKPCHISGIGLTQNNMLK